MDSCIIVIGVGQAGLKTAAAYWIELSRQHRIDPETGAAVGAPTGLWERFFNRVAQGTVDERYVPRCLFIDADQRTADELKIRWRNFFNPANFISSTESSGNNFAVANRRIGDEVVTDIRGAWMRESVKAASVDACIVFHAHGGGSGAGLSARLFEILNQVGSDASLLSVGVLPSRTVSSSVTEPYNALFSLSSVDQHCDAALLFRNDDLQKELDTLNGLENATVSDLNSLIANTVAALTSSSRFENADLESQRLSDVISDLAPHPDFKFFAGAQIGFDQILRKNSAARSVPEILEVLVSQKADLFPTLGGRVFSLMIASTVSSKNPKQEIDSEGVNEFLGTLSRSELSSERAFTVFVNSSRMVEYLKTVCSAFDQLWERRAFANWFVEAGFSESAIEELRREIRFKCDRYLDVEPDSY